MPDSLAERLYYRLPILLQNVTFSMYALAPRRKRFSKHFHDRLAQLRQSEFWSEERIGAFQDEQIRHIVRHAYQAVPFYKRWYDQHHIDPDKVRGREDLERLPILTKALVRENQHDMVSQAYPRRSLHVDLTSGTTGTPLRILKTREAVAFQWAVWWRHRARFGMMPGQRHLMFGARVPIAASQRKPPFWREDYFGHRTYLSIFHLTPANMPAIVDFLNKRSFEYYLGYPSAISVLAQYLLENGIRLSHPPRWTITASESLLPVFENSIRQALGTPVTEHYGMAEFAGNMAKCEQERFHVDFECCHVEGQPLTGSESQHSLIFTGWGNPAMPFIRYEVGDYGTPCLDRCPCGRQSVTYRRIDGRTEDYVRTPDGRVITGLNQVLEYGTGAKEIQVYQDRLEEIEIRVVPGPGYTANSQRALLRELRNRVGQSLQVRFVQLDSIPRTANGKFRAVISKLSDGPPCRSRL